MCLHADTALVTAVNPGFVPTEGFPATDRPSILSLTPERVAETIVVSSGTTSTTRSASPDGSPRWMRSASSRRRCTGGRSHRGKVRTDLTLTRRGVRRPV